MPVRSQIVGIDGPETLEGALRDALYLADDGLATSAYLALALGKPLLCAEDPRIVGVASDAPLPSLALPQLDLNDVEAIADFIVARCGLEGAARGAA